MSLRELIKQMQRHIAAAGEATLGRMLRLLARAIRRELRSLAQIGRGVWTAKAARAVVDRLRRMVVRAIAAMTRQLGADLRATAALSLADAALYLETADRIFGEPTPLRPTTDAATIVAARAGVAATSLGRFGADLVRIIEGAAVATALLGRPHHVALDVVAGALRRGAAAKAWELKRIADTEASAVYNLAQLETLIAQDVPGDRMLKRLVARFDSVTGRDSVMLHGQRRPVREPFYDAHHGRFYMAPPNRPNDREIIVGERERWKLAAEIFAPVPEDRPSRRPPPRQAQAGTASRKARNLRAGDRLDAPGRPRIASVTEARGRITVRTDSGLLLYFVAGAAIGILASS